MLATTMAKNLIESAQFSQIDAIYTLNLPQEVQDNTTSTVVLITDVNSSPDLAGNNEFYAYETQIQIQIFYKLDLDYDPEQLEIPLIQLLKDNQWSVDEIKGHVVDPDTNQVTATGLFSYSKFL